METRIVGINQVHCRRMPTNLYGEWSPALNNYAISLKYPDIPKSRHS
ncbi:MAG: hypothetical protein LBP87_10985 [Planctomycetaceae bacterium]|nr:hypothetical protein [Planctomycetaceae bacterium]